MKYFFTILFFVFQFHLFGQDKNTGEVSFGPVEILPIYPGCESLKSNDDLRKCMSDKISMLISENFDISIAKSLGLPDGLVKISTSFKIDTLGNIIDIKTTTPNPELEKEARRVIGLIPKMLKPATQRGKPVTISQSIPIIFMLKN